jgi:hypothetical protein
VVGTARGLLSGLLVGLLGGTRETPTPAVQNAVTRARPPAAVISGRNFALRLAAASADSHAWHSMRTSCSPDRERADVGLVGGTPD